MKQSYPPIGKEGKKAAADELALRDALMKEAKELQGTPVETERDAAIEAYVSSCLFFQLGDKQGSPHASSLPDLAGNEREALRAKGSPEIAWGK
jgi:hypothetical protein